MRKKIIYVLLPLQLLILVLCPRFGWKLHNTEAIVLPYKETTYVDGRFHALYESGTEKIDVSYKNIFSRQLQITINDNEEYEMTVEIDGRQNGNEKLPYASADLVWNDSSGILWWRYILTTVMTVFSIILLKRMRRIQVFSCILYAISILISLRILF